MTPKQQIATPTEPIDVVDGIADRSVKPAAWQYAALTGVFLAWVTVLLATLLGWL